MKLRRGCGCPIALLVVVDLIFAVGSIVNLIRGPSDQPVTATPLGSALTLVVMAANAIVAGLLAIAAFRGTPLGQGQSAEPSEEILHEGTEDGDSED